MNKTKLLLKLTFGTAIIGLLTSVIMDTYLWFTINYLVPSYTIALMSLGSILLLIVLCYLTVKYENNGENINANSKM